MSRGLRSPSGQATVEYVGIVLVVALTVGAVLTVTGLARPAASLAEAIADRLLCAVRLGQGCAPPASPLQIAYGTELAALVAEHAPEVRFENGEFVSLPVDPRTCRRRSCADSSAPGRLGRSFEDHPATAFIHLIDCREAGPGQDADCSGLRAGNLYLQYWLYYPDSATRPFGRVGGSHADDWESYQVRIGPDGGMDARASSHRSYNHGANPVSDVGLVSAGGASVDARSPGWGPASGFLWVSAGSHAGRVAGDDDYFRMVPAERLRLLPLKSELRSLSELEFEVVPPWLKQVWRDPEHTGT